LFHWHLRRRTPHPETQTVCELAFAWTRDGWSLTQPEGHEKKR